MSEKPILFKGEMVKAILEGRKSQTRRILKPQPVVCPLNPLYVDWKDATYSTDSESLFNELPYKVGDTLWVRETWQAFKPGIERFGGNSAMAGLTMRVCAHPPIEGNSEIEYRADNDKGGNWRPSIFMPRWASRITLKVTGVQIQRLQDITGEDAQSEGVEYCDINGHDDCFFGASLQGYKCSFERLWDSINVKRGYSWESNPWVQVIEFEKVPTEHIREDK